MDSAKNRIICNVGLFDGGYQISRSVGVNGKRKNVWVCPFYSRWKDMLSRCYSPKTQENRPTYKGCTVCEEWLTFSNFKRWMEAQDWEGKELDKDLLVEGNRVYSPKTCLFVSGELNSFLSMEKPRSNREPFGVFYEHDRRKYQSYFSSGGKRKFLGRYKDPMMAHNMWKVEKLKAAVNLQSKQENEVIKIALQRVIDKLELHIKEGVIVTSL